VPATGLGVTLALTDARVLADELLAGPHAVTDALAAYGRRRRRYVDRLCDAAGSVPEEGSNGEPALASARCFRSANVGAGDLLADTGAL
jgi:2-polyprenyl-6-methoxyphenol hydroxylase-like FAD-dependent oxidoreductase